MKIKNIYLKNNFLDQLKLKLKIISGNRYFEISSIMISRRKKFFYNYLH